MSRKAIQKRRWRANELQRRGFHRWRHQFGGIKGPEMAWMKELEKENARLKKIVAQQAMNIDALKDINRKNWQARRASDGRCIIFARSAAARNGTLADWRSSHARRSGTGSVSIMRSGGFASGYMSWPRSIRVRAARVNEFETSV